MIYIACYFYVGFLFAEVLRIGYIAAQIHEVKARRHYCFMLLAWPILITISVVRNWSIR